MTEGEILLELSELDLALMRARKRLDELPEKRAILSLRRQLKEIEDAVERARAYVHDAEQEIARTEDESASIQARISSEEEKLLAGAISDPREVQNVSREIDALKRRVEALEHEQLGLMQKSEHGKEQLQRVEEVLAKGRAKEAELIDAYRRHGGDIQTEIARLSTERSAAAGRLDEATRERYEALREVKHGIAVGVLKGTVCSACRMEIPAAEVQALLAGPEVGECPNCRRMIVVRRDTA